MTLARRNYCSYFDHRYLPRGLVLMESIWRYNPDSHFYVLCLDDECKNLLDRIADSRIIGIPLATLEAFDPELSAAKATRSTVEYYFTCTPCLPNYLFQTFLELDAITYLDADLWFFADPELVYAEIGDASIAITPHRFSPERRHLERYGRYNVGWITWKNDADGRRCIEDYRRNCIAWCYDRLEDGRFADQKYLDRWPSSYGTVHEIAHIGVNLAPWNVNGCVLSAANGLLFANDKRVIFFHFHALRQMPDGRWMTSIDGETATRHPLLTEGIYRPYVERLREKIVELEMRFGKISQFSDLRYTPKIDKPEAPSPPGWSYIGPAWPESDSIDDGGWAGPSVVQVRMQQLENFRRRAKQLVAGSDPVEQTNALVCSMAVNRLGGDAPSVSVLDWGGAFGATGLAMHALLHPRRLEYTIKEVPDICRAFAPQLPGVRFIDNDDEALADSFDIVIASAAMHYRADWRGLFARLAKSARRGLLLTRQPVLSDAPSYVARQGAYGTSFTCWILNERELIGEAQRHGFEMIFRFLSHDGAQIAGAPRQPAFHSYVLGRRAPVPAPGSSA